MKLLKKYWIAIFIVFVFFLFFKQVVSLLIFGCVFGYYGIDSIILLERLDSVGIKCKGKILSFESDNEGYKTPIVEFTTIAGELIKGKPILHVSTDLDKVRSYKNDIDKEVPILYEQEDPEIFILTNEQDMNYSFPIIAIFMSLVIIITSILSLFD
jgi:hypothetical protein